MKVSFKFGQNDLVFTVPDENIAFVASPKNKPQVGDLKAETLHAIRNPIGMEPLAELARRAGKKTVILVDDLTRVTPHKVILPLLLDELNAAGVADDDITLLIALGTHREMTDAECLETYGEEAIRRCKIVNHTWDMPENLVDMGKTPSGIPINVNRHYCESDISIAVGNIIPHIFAGWSGGGKMVQPGVCGAVTTAETHLLGVKDIENTLGNAENIVRKEIEAIARETGLSMIINTVMNSDNTVAAVVAGDLVEAHRAGVKIAQEIYCVDYDEKVDIMICNSYPGDLDFWQGSKGMTSGTLFTKQGGDVISVVWGKEGLAPSHPELYELTGKSSEELRNMIDRKEVSDEVAGATALLNAFIRERVSMSVVTLPENKHVIEAMNFEFAAQEDIEKTINEAIKKHGKDCKIGIATHGADLAPKVKKASSHKN